DGAPAIGGSENITGQAGNIVNSVPLRFGAEQDTGPIFAWQGSIDEVFVYRRALLAQEVSDLYPLTIVSSTVPAGTNNVPYNHSLVALGGQPPYIWSLTSGSLSPGLVLSQNGVVSGTPSTVGTSIFTVRVQDSAFRT